MLPTTRRRPERSSVSPSWSCGALLTVRHSSGNSVPAGLLGTLLAFQCSGCSAPSRPLTDLLATQRPLGDSASSRLPRTSWQTMRSRSRSWSRSRSRTWNRPSRTFCPEPLLEPPRLLIRAGSGVGAGAVLKFPESKHLVRTGNAGAGRFYPESELENPENSEVLPGIVGTFNSEPEPEPGPE